MSFTGSPSGLLTPELLAALRSPGGLALLCRAESLADDPFAAQKLRREAPAELAAAAVEQVLLRRRAAAKFTRAAEMWFSAPLLEQASGDVVAIYRLQRYAAFPSPLGDFCCGLGGDAVQLARHARVLAVDRDPLALALTQANAEVFGVAARVETQSGVLPEAAPDVSAAWVDPGRRESGRTRRLDAVSPPLSAILTLLSRIPHLGIKLSPASDDAELDAALRGISHEREFLSVGGECKELVLWTGDLPAAGPPPGNHIPTTVRRATLLPSGESLAGEPLPYEATGPTAEYLLEPDPAVIRAGLVGNLAAKLSAWPIDPKLAYLSLEQLPPAGSATRLAKVYRLASVEPFSGKALTARLRQMEAGNAVFKTRGSALQPETLRHQVRGVLKHGRPDCCPVVFITRLGGRATMMVGERIEPANR